jgi:glycosyltransferase involved in cell wall biosynthesis
MCASGYTTRNSLQEVFLRVLLISKACVVGTYQRKLEEMAALDDNLQLTLAVPPFWRDQGSRLILEKVHTQGYTVKVLPIALNGRFHFHFYPQLAHLIQDSQPDIVHIDEEPYNVATFHANVLARRVKSRTLWFSWQNLDRHYPPPFSWIEQYNLKNVDYAIVGSQTSSQIWRNKGYKGPLAVIPQFGVDPVIFSPPEKPRSTDTIRILFAGRLVAEKGVDLLIHALSQLKNNWHATLLGNGPEERVLKQLVQIFKLTDKVSFRGHIASTKMPDLYREIDILVLPSRTLPNWTEQFGRVLVEAMSCGVCVVGSDTGEIPHVIGNAGLIFPEDDVDSLRAHLQYLVDSPELRADLGKRGRQRILERYTQSHIAQATLEVYKELVP